MYMYLLLDAVKLNGSI